jgi:hypothetical protein
MYEVRAQQFKVAPAEPAATELEKQASRLIVERIGGAGRGFGGGRGQAGGEGLSPEARAAMQAMQAAQRKIPQHMTAELNMLMSRKITALEIRDFLSGEFDPLPLADLMDYLRAAEKAGMAKLTEKPEEPKPVPAAAPAKGKKPPVQKPPAQ